MNRHHLLLWLLLAVSFAAIICVSVFGPVNLFGYELKDSGISEAFASVKNLPGTESSDSAVVENPDSVVEEATPKIVETDTTAKRILFVGDSMLDGLYPRLAAYADRNGHELYAVIWYSSTSEVWGKSDKLKGYIARLNPDYIFICLGANELFVKDIEKKRTQYVRNILNDIGEIPYLWIGPPNWKEDTGINDMLAKNTSKGSFFLSDGMHFERKKDGAHPTSASADKWMDSVVRWMPANSSHPIRLEIPENTHGRAKRVFVHSPDEK